MSEAIQTSIVACKAASQNQRILEYQYSCETRPCIHEESAHGQRCGTARCATAGVSVLSSSEPSLSDLLSQQYGTNARKACTQQVSSLDILHKMDAKPSVQGSPHGNVVTPPYFPSRSQQIGHSGNSPVDACMLTGTALRYAVSTVCTR